MTKTNLQIIVHVLNTIATDLDTDSLDALINLGDILEGKEIKHVSRGRWLRELSELNAIEFADYPVLQARMQDQKIADKIAKAESAAILGITNNLNRNDYGASLYNAFLVAFQGDEKKASQYFDQAIDLALSETEDTDVDFAPGVRGFGGTVIADIPKTGPQIIGDVLVAIQHDANLKIIPAIKLLVKVIDPDVFDYDAVCRADWLKSISQISQIEYIYDEKLRNRFVTQIKADKFVEDNRAGFATFDKDAYDPQKVAIGQNLFNELHRALATNSDADSLALEYFSAAVDMQECIAARAEVTAAVVPTTAVAREDYSAVFFKLLPIVSVASCVLILLAVKLTNSGKALTNWSCGLFKNAKPEIETDESASLLNINVENADKMSPQ